MAVVLLFTENYCKKKIKQTMQLRFEKLNRCTKYNYVLQL